LLLIRQSAVILLQIIALFFWQKNLSTQRKIRNYYFLSQWIRSGGCPLRDFVLSNFSAASLRYNITGQLFVLLVRNLEIIHRRVR